MIGKVNAPMYGQKRNGKVPRWCNRCGRKHSPQRPCNLVLVERKAKSGKMVTRLVHPGRI